MHYFNLDGKGNRNGLFSLKTLTVSLFLFVFICRKSSQAQCPTNLPSPNTFGSSTPGKKNRINIVTAWEWFLEKHIKPGKEYLNSTADSSGEFSTAAGREQVDVSTVIFTQPGLHYFPDTQVYKRVKMKESEIILHSYKNTNH